MAHVHLLKTRVYLSHHSYFTILENSNIDQFKKNLEEISNTNQLRFDELFKTEFLSEYTSFTFLDDMFEKSGFKVEAADDSKAIPDQEWEDFIIANTSFERWEDMQKAAAVAVLSKRMHLGLK